MLRALSEYEIGELKTLMPFHKAMLETEQWARGETCRDLIEDRAWLKTLAFPRVEPPPRASEAEAGRAGLHGRGLRQALRGAGLGPPHRRRRAQQRRAATAARRRRPAAAPKRSQRGSGPAGRRGDTLTSPLQGNVLKVPSSRGDACRRAS